MQFHIPHIETPNDGARRTTGTYCNVLNTALPPLFARYLLAEPGDALFQAVAAESVACRHMPRPLSDFVEVELLATFCLRGEGAGLETRDLRGVFTAFSCHSTASLPVTRLLM